MRFVSITTATLASYGFNLPGKWIPFSFQNLRIRLFFKASPNAGVLATHVWRFLGGRGVGGVTREVSYALKGENKYFDLGKNKTRLWR